MTDTSSTNLIERASALVAVTSKAASAYQRPDLAGRLGEAATRLGEADLTALVVGEFKQGKSTLVNSLLNIPLCPVDDDVATVVPTIVRHGESASAAVLLEPPSEPERPPVDLTRIEVDTGLKPDPVAKPIELGEIAGYASEAGNPNNVRGVRAVQIAVPRRLLGTGLALIDTPGVGGLESIHGAATTAVLGMAEVVVFVSDASQELTEPETSFLRQAVDRCPNVVCVLTKVDLYPDWRRIAELDAQHLREAGLGEVPILPVASPLRQKAIAEDDADLNAESGYPAFVRWLSAAASGRGQALSARTVVSDVAFVLDQLETGFRTERELLADPDKAAEVIAGLEAAKDRADRLKSRSARWQQTLSDLSQDLANDIDHDLRRRMRDIGQQGEKALDDSDPVEIWEEFEGWLRQRAADEIAVNNGYVRTRAEYLAARVSEHFAIDQEAPTDGVELDITIRATLDAELSLELDRTGAAGGALTALRGGYGGVLMFGMIGQLAGLAMLGPASVVIGVGMGRKALREERKRQLTMRRQQAKQAMRKFLDEVSFTFGKEQRDVVKRVQRDLRDEFTSRAEQLMRSTREALQSAEKAARETIGGRDARIHDIDAELARLGTLRESLAELERHTAAVLEAGE